MKSEAYGIWGTVSTSPANVGRSCSHIAQRIISHTWFKRLDVILIMMNCIALAFDDPTAEQTPWVQRLVDVVFTAAFSAEMALKLTATGLDYFKDLWNWIDMVVLSEGLASVFSSGLEPGVRSIRILRVLRPLRTVRRLPKVQHVVSCLVKVGWTLGRIVCVFMVWLTVFAIMGVLLWSGTFDNRCYTLESSYEVSPATLVDPFEPKGRYAGSHRRLQLHPGGSTPMWGGRRTSLTPVKPFRAGALEADSMEPLPCFVSGEDRELAKSSSESSLSSSLSSNGSLAEEVGDGADQVYVELGLCGIQDDMPASPVCRSLGALNMPYTCEEGEVCMDSGSPPGGGMVSFDNLLWSLLTLFTVTTLEGWHEVMMHTQRVTSEHTLWFFILLIVSATWAIMSLMIAAMLSRFKAVSFAENLKRMEEKEEARAAAEAKRQASVIALPPPSAWSRFKWSASRMLRGTISAGFKALQGGFNRVTELISNHAKEDGWAAASLRYVRTNWQRLKELLGLPGVTWAVRSEESFFAQVIHLAMLLNIVVISMGGYNVSGRKARVLEDVSLALTGTFAAEAAIKIFVLGRKVYFRSSWNCFDFFVTLTSVVEAILTARSHDGNIAAAIRLLKVLRVFRIFRMRRIKRTAVNVLGVVLRSARELWPVVALMLLVMFVFTVLGMQLFGMDLNPNTAKDADDEYALKLRFDTFFWSFVQVFMVISGDNWTAIMYRTMEHTHVSSAAFFVTLITLGQFVMLNLVLAVVLEGASNQMKVKYAAQQFKQNTLGIMQYLYKKIALRRWSVKTKALTMLELGKILVLREGEAEMLGLEGFPCPKLHRPKSNLSARYSCCCASGTDCSCVGRSRVPSSVVHGPGSSGPSAVPPLVVCSPGVWFASFTSTSASSRRSGSEPSSSRSRRSSVDPDDVDGLDSSGPEDPAGGISRRSLLVERVSSELLSASKRSLSTTIPRDLSPRETGTVPWPDGDIGDGGDGGSGRFQRHEDFGGDGASDEKVDHDEDRDGELRKRRIISDVVAAFGGLRTKSDPAGNYQTSTGESKMEGLSLLCSTGGSRMDKSDRDIGTTSVENPSPGVGGQERDGDVGKVGDGEGDDGAVAENEEENDGGMPRCEINEQEAQQERTEVNEGLPRVMYGVFKEMTATNQKAGWWKRLDWIFGPRMDQLTWDKWYIKCNPVRQWCHNVVEAPHFENTMMAIVLVSTVLSMYDTDSPSSTVGILDSVCLAAFVTELSLRVGSCGWWSGPEAILRHPWSLLDVYLVACHGLTTTATVLGITALISSKRVLKSARPLRIIRRIKPLQEIASSLVYSLRSCGTLLVLIATVWFGYSILGMELYGGKFYSCTDPFFLPGASRFGEFDSDTGVWISPPCSGEWVNPATGLAEMRDYEWKNAVYHFDNIGAAMLSVLIIATLDGWVAMFFLATNATGVDRQPSANTNTSCFWYFFFGVIIFGFYITNLFVGVMFEAFLSYKNLDSQSRLVSQEERRWRDYEKRLLQVSAIVAPSSCRGQPWRKRVQDLVTSDCFNNFVLGVLVVNTLVLATDGADIPEWQSRAQDQFSDVFALIFVVEAVVELIGLGTRCYFSAGRQRFDFIVALASLADLLLNISDTCAEYDIVLLRFVRALRVFRVVRLATHIPGFNQILTACVYPSKVLACVFTLLALGIYIFANLGVALFSSADFERMTAHVYQDFSSVWRAMQLLFIVATGESWAAYAERVWETASQPKSLVMVFFVVFIIIMQFILTNLFIMVIVETFEVLNSMERQDLEDQLPRFQELWAKYDPLGSGYIFPGHLYTFILNLHKPLGVNGEFGVAGRYVSLLRSSPDFDHSFSKVLLGLGAALLSQDRNGDKRMGYQPMDFRKLMSAIIIQRAMKRNLRLSQARANLNDVVLEQQLPRCEHIRGLTFVEHDAVRKRDPLGRTVARSQVERLRKQAKEVGPSWAFLGGLRGFDWLRNVPWNFGLHSKNISVPIPVPKPVPVRVPKAVFERNSSSKTSGEPREVGTFGSLYFPPNQREIDWIMSRYLRNLRRRRDLGVDDDAGSDPDRPAQQQEMTPGRESAPPGFGHRVEPGGQSTFDRRRNVGAGSVIPGLEEAFSISGKGDVEAQGRGNPELSCAEAPGE